MLWSWEKSFGVFCLKPMIQWMKCVFLKSISTRILSSRVKSMLQYIFFKYYPSAKNSLLNSRTMKATVSGLCCSTLRSEPRLWAGSCCRTTQEMVLLNQRSMQRWPRGILERSPPCFPFVLHALLWGSHFLWGEECDDVEPGVYFHLIRNAISSLVILRSCLKWRWCL